jgi:tetratricopeptide (TPR) repeat protein
LLRDALDEANPQDNLLGLLAGLELASDHYVEAARLYELGAKTDPGETKWTKSLARVYLKSGQTDKLADALVRLAALDPDDATVRKKLMSLASAAQDHAATVRWGREVLQIDVMDPDVHRWLATALVALGQPDEAADEYEATVELAPDDPALRLALARTYVAAKQSAKARTTLEELLKIDPKNSDAARLLEGLKP